MVIGGDHRPILLTAPNQYATIIYYDSTFCNYVTYLFLIRGDGTFCTAAVEGDKIVKAVRPAIVVCDL